MESILRRLSQGISQLNEYVGRAVSWLNTLLVLLVMFDVVTRYVFSDSAAWIMELEWHFFALVFLLGAGYAFKHDRHVRVDLFYARMSRRDRALVNLVGNIVFLAPWCIVIIYAAFQYAMVSYRVGETSPDPGGLPARYLIKFAIAVGVSLLLLQAVSGIIDSALALRRERNNPQSE